MACKSVVAHYRSAHCQYIVDLHAHITLIFETTAGVDHRSNALTHTLFRSNFVNKFRVCGQKCNISSYQISLFHFASLPDFGIGFYVLPHWVLTLGDFSRKQKWTMCYCLEIRSKSLKITLFSIQFGHWQEISAFHSSFFAIDDRSLSEFPYKDFLSQIWFQKQLTQLQSSNCHANCLLKCSSWAALFVNQRSAIKLEHSVHRHFYQSEIALLQIGSHHESLMVTDLWCT